MAALASVLPGLASRRAATATRTAAPCALALARTRTRTRTRALHSSAVRGATPLAHPSVPGPPPATPAPAPAAADALERVARKQRQAEMLQHAKDARAAAAAKPQSPLKKRFWADVHVRDAPDAAGYHVFLDARPVRSPSKDALTIPRSKPQLAAAIALEWDLLVSAQQALKTHYIPLTSLAARALDVQRADAAADTRIRDSVVQLALRYLSTDTLLCWAPERVANDVKQNGKTLRQLQQAVATDIIAHLSAHVWPAISIRPILAPDSIVPLDQLPATTDAIRAWVAALPAYELAGFERAVLASKSVLIAARLLHDWSEAFANARPHAAPRFGIDDAAEAASLEVRWQTAAWGEVEDTHDVEKEDMKRQLGSVILLVGGDAA